MAMATSSTTGRLAAFPPLLISQIPRSHPIRLRFTRVVRSLNEEKEAAAPNGVDFDGKLPLYAPAVFRRRFILGTVTGTAIALGADFLGSSSAILSLNPEFFRGIRADVLYPIRGYKRCYETSRGFVKFEMVSAAEELGTLCSHPDMGASVRGSEFIFPKNWVGDQTLLYRAIERGERERSLDLPSLQQQNRRRATEPVVAFGPPGSIGELNVSVIVAPVASGFKLEKLGDPEQAGTTILLKSIAPEGSNKVAKLINASRCDDAGVVYYTLEYTVQGPLFFRHNVAVYAVNNGELYSLNAQTSETAWPSVQGQFRSIANSFRLLL